MSDLRQFTTKLRSGIDLTEAEAMAAAGWMPRSDVDPLEKKAFLTALHQKGESIDEVTAFAKVFRKLAADPELADLSLDAIDIVGTGGSGSGGFNISSVTAMIVAASGTRVLKHGNRAITSKSGSADFLAENGIRMDTDPLLLRAAIEELNFCFFFAPVFHPAFKEIMPVRKELAAEGQRTIFNILGPLINPAKPGYQLLGVFSAAWVKPLADVLGNLGARRGLAVCSELSNGKRMDEFTTAGDNQVAGFGSLEGMHRAYSPTDLGFPPSDPAELVGGSAVENVAMLEDMLQGNGRQGLVDSIAVNAAMAFMIVGKVESIGEGCALAREVLLGGALRSWLERARAFYRENGSGE